MPPALTIGQLAKQAGVHVETIRFYQRRGLLLEPARPLGRIRRYGEMDAQRIRFIKHAQALGFSLDEVAELLALDDGRHCQEAEAIASRKLLIVRERLRQLRRIERLLGKMVSQCQCNPGTVRCPLIEELGTIQADL